MTDDAAGIVAADVERGGNNAALYQVGAAGKAYNSRRVILTGSDGAGHGEVADSGSVDVAE